MVSLLLMSKTVAFYTLGCKLNFSETSTIGRMLIKDGYQKVAFESGADVYVINTCSVTDHADRKCRKIVNEALRINTQARIVVTGCFAQLKPESVSRIPGVDLVLGAAEKFDLSLYQTLNEKKEQAQIFQRKIREVNEYHGSYSIGDRTRSFLKVQDGCDYFCSFCTIPLARGASRSAKITEVISQANEIVESGIHEIVLTGVNTGDFGVNNGESFLGLLNELIQIKNLKRLRISSIEPNLLNDGIIQLAAENNCIMPHFHIPLQSGSDELLQKMNRRYNVQLFADRVQLIKQLMPHACIGVDVIVGFPGESDEHFNQTYHFLNDLDISYLHVFTYSERPNTRALKLSDPVPGAKRSERNQMLQILSEKKKRAFYQTHIGTNRNVLWEAENIGNKILGFTDNYIRVSGEYSPELVNEITPYKLSEISPELIMNGDFLPL